MRRITWGLSLCSEENYNYNSLYGQEEEKPWPMLHNVTRSLPAPFHPLWSICRQLLPFKGEIRWFDVRPSCTSQYKLKHTTGSLPSFHSFLSENTEVHSSPALQSAHCMFQFHVPSLPPWLWVPWGPLSAVALCLSVLAERETIRGLGLVL